MSDTLLISKLTQVTFISRFRTNDCIFESVIKYDIFRCEWVDVAAMEVGRILPGVTTLSSKIYVVGGERGSQIFANGEVYDPISNTWESLPAMNTPRCEFGLCALGGTLWAIGGWIGEDIGDSIESYDPIKACWETVDKLPEPRFSMGVVSKKVAQSKPQVDKFLV